MIARVLCLGILLSFALRVPAQIIGVELVSRKAEKEYSRWLLKKKGKLMIVGEPLSGLEVNEKGGIDKPSSPASITLLVPDPARPELELWNVDRSGRSHLKAKHRKVVIKPGDFKVRDGFHLIYRYENTVGLRNEYFRNKDKVDAIQKELDTKKKGSKEWFSLHRKLLVETDALVAWLENGMFPVAAEKLARQYAKELAEAGEEGSKSRLETAKAAMERYPLPEDLIKKLREMGRTTNYVARQAQHVRVVAHGGLDPTTVEGLVVLGERIIEGFRTDFVDPFLGPEGVDPIPDGLIVEFFLCPDDQDLMERLFEEYYLADFGYHREQAIKLLGHQARKVRDIDYLRFWRMAVGADPEGIIGSAMGKILGNIVYNQGKVGGPPHWLQQAFGYWVSFEFLGRNTVIAFDWNKRTYERSKRKEGVKTVEVGMRAALNNLALTEGPALSDLMVMTVADMEAHHVAKAWSFVDWIFTAETQRSDRLFKAISAARERDGKTDLVKLRQPLREIFGIAEEGRDVYPILDDMWREFATRSQLSVKRKRK